MKRKLIALVMLSTFQLLILGGLGGVQIAAAAEKPIVWTFASSSGAAANMWGFNPYPRFQKMVEQATDGRLKLDTKVDLFDFKGTMNGVIKGGADIGFQRLPFVSGTFPILAFGSLPFFFENVFEYEAALNDPEMVKIIDEIYAKYGLVKLFESPSTALDAMFGNKPIRTLADFKNLKVRTAGLLPTFTLQLMGASPLTMSAMEISEALKRGTVDVVSTSPGYGLGSGMTDVTKYISYWPIQSGYGGAVVMNKRSWDKLPADIQAALRDVGKRMQEQVFFASHCEYSVARKGIEVAGLETVVPDRAELDKAREMARPAIDKWLEVAGDKAPDVLRIAAKYASGAKIMLAK